jgi:hypothetical protein
MDLNAALRATTKRFERFEDFGQTTEDKEMLYHWVDIDFIREVIKSLNNPNQPIDWTDSEERNALNNIGIWYWFTKVLPEDLKTGDREVFPSEQSRIQIGHQLARTRKSPLGSALKKLFKEFLSFATVSGGNNSVKMWAMLKDGSGFPLLLAKFMIPQSTEEKYYLEFARGREKMYFDRALRFFNSQTGNDETEGKARAVALQTINLAVDAEDDASSDTYTQEATAGSMMAASGDAEALSAASIAP